MHTYNCACMNIFIYICIDKCIYIITKIGDKKRLFAKIIIVGYLYIYIYVKNVIVICLKCLRWLIDGLKFWMTLFWSKYLQLWAQIWKQFVCSDMLLKLWNGILRNLKFSSWKQFQIKILVCNFLFNYVGSRAVY